jgi:hypothetical protein
MPGCWSQGQTEQEAMENIKDAIEAYLAAVDELSQDKESRSSLNLQYRRKTSTARRTPPSPVSVIWEFRRPLGVIRACFVFRILCFEFLSFPVLHPNVQPVFPSPVFVIRNLIFVFFVFRYLS